MNESIKVYIKINDKNLVTEINSSIFLQDVDGYLLIDDGYSDKYAHAQGHYLDRGIYDIKGRCNYIYDAGEVRLLAEEEKSLFPSVR